MDGWVWKSLWAPLLRAPLCDANKIRNVHCSHLMASKCLWMGTLTGRLVASKKSVNRFLEMILVWATLTWTLWHSGLTSPPQAGKTKETSRSRLSGSSTLPLGSSTFSSLFSLFYHTSYQSLLQARAEESTSKSAEVKIVQLSTWAVCLEDIWLPSSQHGATCSLHLMRNWTGPWAAISYPPSLPELIPICPLCASNVFAIVRSAPRMYYCTITTSQYCTYHPPSKYLSLFVRSAPQMYYCHLPRIVHTSHILSIVPATFQGSGPRLLLLPTSFSPPCFCLHRSFPWN